MVIAFPPLIHSAFGSFGSALAHPNFKSSNCGIYDHPLSLPAFQSDSSGTSGLMMTPATNGYAGFSAMFSADR